MVRTIVFNNTSQDFTLKEGNAGVYRDIKVLASKEKHTIELDTNATYREYVVVQNTSGEKEYITSDDCLDNSKITIVMDGTKHKFEKEARNNADGAKKVGEASAGHHGFFSRFVKMFK